MKQINKLFFSPLLLELNGLVKSLSLCFFSASLLVLFKSQAAFALDVKAIDDCGFSKIGCKTIDGDLEKSLLEAKDAYENAMKKLETFKQEQLRQEQQLQEEIKQKKAVESTVKAGMEVLGTVLDIFVR